MKVLFVCNGNVARSQEAEVLFNQTRLDRNNLATSAGLNVKPGKPIDPLVFQVMNEAGIDLSGAKRKFVTEAMAHDADLIISFCPETELPDYLKRSKEVRYWDIPDPRHQSVDFHRRVRDEIRSKVSLLSSELVGTYEKRSI